MSDILPKLLGSTAKVKLLRLFLFNPNQPFTTTQIVERSRCKSSEVRRELAVLHQVKLIKRTRRSSRGAIRYVLNEDFAYLAALQNLLLNTPEKGTEIYEKIRRTGAIKLLVLSGMFVGEWDGKIDLLIVGDRVKESRLTNKIRGIESELGKELRYALMNTTDFMYRLNMSDHLVRDVLDYPHTIVHDRLDIGLK